MMNNKIIPSNRRFPPFDPEFMKKFVDNAPNAIVVFDNAKRFFAASSRFKEDYGLENIELIGRHLDEIFPDISDKWRDALSRSLAGDSLRCEKDHFIRSDGTSYWLRWDIFPWLEVNGLIAGSIIFIEMMTQEIDAEESLELVLSATEIGIWERDLIRNKVNMTPQAERLMGYVPGTFGDDAQTFDDLVHHEDLSLLWEATEEAIRKKRPVRVRFRIIWPDGSIHWIYGLSKFDLSEDGSPVRLRGVSMDVTEMEEIRAALKFERDRLNSILAVTSSAEVIARYGSWEFDLTSGARSWSQGLYRVFGIDPSNGIPSREDFDRNFIHPDDLDRVTRAFIAATERPSDISLEHRIIRADNSVRWVKTTGQIEFNDDAQPIRMIGSTQDITEAHQMETELRELQADLEMKIDERTKELSIATEAKSRFLANMSHEIRNPLNSVTILSSILGNENIDGIKRKELVSRIAVATKSVTAILDEILDFSKIESGNTALEPGPLVLSQMFDEVRGIFEARAEAKGLILDIAPICVDEVLLGDEKKLKQVLVNLVGNAIKFTDAGSVWVNTQIQRKRPYLLEVAFEVIDTGIGIAPESIPSLFLPFTQADNGITRKYGGTGLGLSISKSLIELMGGELEVTSTLGLGSEFRFTIDLPIQHNFNGNGNGNSLPLDTALLQNLRILLVDDDEANTESMREFLQSIGLGCVTAHNGALAVDLLDRSPDQFDLVLMDIQMPVMDGITACRKIRNELNLKSLPIIAITAGVLPHQQQEAISAGITELIRKPVDHKVLTETLLRYRLISKTA
jgi:PAS domain S-box-containing protein